MRVSRESIGGVVIVGILAAMMWPQFTDTGRGGGMGSNLLSTLQTIRSQIELYNVQNPETRYDAMTPVGPTFWDPLVQNDYLQMAPHNPFQNNSSLVVASPTEGAGWVWGETSAGRPWTLSVYAVDGNGNFFDWDKDGLPD